MAVAPAVLVERREDREEAGVPGDREPEECQQSGLVHVDDAEVTIADQRAHVGLEIDGRAVGKAAAAAHADAEPVAHDAVGAVGRDQVAGAERPVRPAVARTQPDDDSPLVLREARHLRGVVMIGAELAGPLAQHRLEPDLRDEQPRSRTQALDPLVERAIEAGELLPAQGIDGNDGAVLDELALGGRLHRLLQPDAAEDLHRALVKRGRARVDRRAPVPLDEHVGDTVRRQQHGGGQPDEAAANHQHGNFRFRLRHTPQGFDGFPPRKTRSAAIALARVSC